MYSEFLKITGYNLEAFFERFTTFISNNSQKIMDYYSGLLSTLDRDSYEEHQFLLKESDYVVNLFDLNQERFNTVDFWELMLFADDIHIKLETIANFSKFARSSVSKESFTSDVTIETPTRDNETLEEMIFRLGSTDRDSDWVDIALQNVVIQEDYTLEGGNLLKVNFKNNFKFFISSVLDNPEGDKIKGVDLDKKISFEDNDLKVLSYNDTLNQTVDILANLKKNDNPEFPTDGIDKTLVVGMSVKAIALPSVIRQIYQIFSTDDLIKQVQILNTRNEQDALHMDLNIIIKSGEEQRRTLSVNGN